MTTSDQDRALQELAREHDSLEVTPTPTGSIRVDGRGPCGWLGDATYRVSAAGEISDITDEGDIIARAVGA